MERGAIIAFMMLLAVGLAALAWNHLRLAPKDSAMCATAEAHCLERPYFN